MKKEAPEGQAAEVAKPEEEPKVVPVDAPEVRKQNFEKFGAKVKYADELERTSGTLFRTLSYAKFFKVFQPSRQWRSYTAKLRLAWA